MTNEKPIRGARQPGTLAADLAAQFHDTRSTVVHRQLGERAAETLARLPCVQAILLIGSLARGTADALSDVDLLVVQDDAEESWAKIDDYLICHLSDIGNPLHWYRSMVNQRDLLVYFSPWVMVEFIVRTGEQSRSNWKTAPSKVLFDRSSVGEQLTSQSASLRPSMANSRREVERVLDAFLVVCMRVQGYYLRGELMTAHHDLAWLRDKMLMLACAVLGQWHEGPRRAEWRLPEEILQVWRASHPTSDGEVPSATHALIDWYTDWLTPRLKSHEIHCPSIPAEVAREFEGLLING